MLTQPTTAQPKPEKKAYQPPKLVEHGTIQNMTLSGTAGAAEGASSSPNKQRP